MDQTKKVEDLKTDDLNKFYEQAVTIDKRLFQEQRSNVLLYSGEHYARPGSRFQAHVRDNTRLDNNTKIRITKNHIQKICKIYMNNILNYAPGVSVMPRNQKELQDQKSAELNESVWKYIKETHKLDKKLEDWVHDFIVQGEVFVKVFWNPSKGTHVGYKQAVDKNGEPLFEDEQKTIPKAGDAIFSGDLEFERMFSFNTLRDSHARSIDDSPWLCYQKLLPKEEADVLVGHDKEKMELLQEGESSDYIAFDASDQRYVEIKDQVLIREWFFRPCAQYPNGYYIMDTKKGILTKMELPGGIFPVVYAGFDEMSSTPRHYSVIKICRPFQGEINRCASKIVEHQITLGDDKIITSMGSKMVQGSQAPGIRHVQVSDSAPTILAGRTGEQYVQYMMNITSEMYAAAMIPEDNEEKGSQLDAYALLFRSMKEKKRFSKYATKIERFQKEICALSLELYKFYAPEDALIPAVGKSEMINIAEFKSTDPSKHHIQVMPQTEDAETKLGMQIQVQNLLQYAGSNLQKEDLGRLMRLAPYTNKEKMFEDWTTDYDNSVNDILALDRGEYPPARQFDKHEYQVTRLQTRMGQGDWPMVHPYIKQLYEKKIQEHNATIAANLQAVQQAESGFIPADGPLTPCDLYVTDPSSPNKTQRARVPFGALLWLIKKLETQGVSQQALQQLSQGGMASLAQHISTPQVNGGQMANQQGASVGNLQQPYLFDRQGGTT